VLTDITPGTTSTVKSCSARLPRVACDRRRRRSRSRMTRSSDSVHTDDERPGAG
jgi:hypothetical protein